MKPYSNLRLLLLAHLQMKTELRIDTRYQLMTITNQVMEILDTPYSPGAVYHETRKLQHEKLIEINQSFVITTLGEQSLHNELTQSPSPEGLVPLLVRCYVIAILTNTDTKKIAAKKLAIKMIDFNHVDKQNDSKQSDDLLALNLWRQNVSALVKKSVSQLLTEI